MFVYFQASNNLANGDLNRLMHDYLMGNPLTQEEKDRLLETLAHYHFRKNLLHKEPYQFRYSLHSPT
jgi:hypothetical protein